MRNEDQGHKPINHVAGECAEAKPVIINKPPLMSRDDSALLLTQQKFLFMGQAPL